MSASGSPRRALTSSARRLATRSGAFSFGHARAHETLIDESLQRFDVVWAAAGHPRAVFEISVGDLIAAVPEADVTDVTEG